MHKTINICVIGLMLFVLAIIGYLSVDIEIAAGATYHRDGEVVCKRAVIINNELVAGVECIW